MPQAFFMPKFLDRPNSGLQPALRHLKLFKECSFSWLLLLESGSTLQWAQDSFMSQEEVMDPRACCFELAIIKGSAWLVSIN